MINFRSGLTSLRFLCSISKNEKKNPHRFAIFVQSAFVPMRHRNIVTRKKQILRVKERQNSL